MLSEIRSDEELDENDILMLIGMGYEEELRRTLGDARVDSVKYHQDDTEPQDAGIGADRKQTQKEKEHFHRENKRLRLRFVVTAVLTAFFGVYDHLALFRSAETIGTDPFLSTLAYPLVGMLLFWGCLAVSWRFLYRSVQELLHFEATPFSAVTFAVVADVLYDGIMLFRWQSGTQMFHFAVCFLLLACTVGEILYLRRTVSSYEVAASEANKYVLEPMQNEPLRFYEGTRVRRVQTARSEKGDGRETRMYRVRKVDRLTGFFRRSEDLSSGCAWLIYLFAALFLIAVAAGCAVGALQGSFNRALGAFMTVLLAGVPLSVPLYYALSGYYAATQLEKSGCALIGDAAVEQYAGKKTLVFSDTEMFVVRRRTRIKIRGEAEVKECTRLLQQLFHAIGGTLEGVAGDPDPDDSAADSVVQIADVSEDGIELYKDGATHILMGDYAYLTKNDIPMPSVENSLGNLQRQEDSAVVYVAVDGRFKMGYAVDYEERKNFLRAADTLMRMGIGVAISSYDPNINEVFMARHAHGGEDQVIRVIKPERLRARNRAMNRTADSGILVTGREENMVEPVVTCEKLQSVRRFGKRLQILYSVLLALVTGVLVWTGAIGAVNGLEIAGVQILVCLPVFGVIRYRLCTPDTGKKGKKNKKEKKKQ
ncbi:uncharacterized protein BN660_01742 [Clostridium sp. CAG:448]|nr:uncharacterized protein BN660_01742 [Clostridium sp. CAG:448]